MTWIQTHRHAQFDFASPNPDSVDIETIAVCLARIQRFGGHLFQSYTVAEHSMLVAQHCEPRFRLEALLHDASEAYIGDIVRPLKMMVPELQAIERNVIDAIWQHFDLSIDAWDEIKHWDNVLLATEARDLFLGGPIGDWHLRYAAPLPTCIEPIRDEVSIRGRFMQKFHRYSTDRGPREMK